MGSFIGHAVPGSFFFLYGVWVVTQAFRRHFRCRRSQRPFRSTLTFPFPYCPGQRLKNFPWESVMKMLFSGFGIVVEIIGGINHNSHRFDSIGNTQHITMYFFYGFSGVIDILVMKDLAPTGSDYVMFIGALLVEGALFKFHLFGRDQLDILLHVLLLYVIGFSVLVVAIEAACRKYSLLPILRGLLFMLQGTWFWGVGYILYNPFLGHHTWDPEDHHALMLAVVCFSWHLAANLLLVMAMGAATGCCYRSWRSTYSKLSTVPLEVLEKGEEEEEERGLLGPKRGEGSRVGEKKKNANGDVPLGVYHDEEEEDDLSDLEFQAPVVVGGGGGPK